MSNPKSFRFVLTLGGFLTFALSASAASAEPAMVFENEYVVTREQSTRAAHGAPSVEVLHFDGSAGASTRAAHVRRKVRVDSTMNRCAQIQAADSSVKTCDPNHVIKINATPNDPRFTNLWGLRNTTGGPDVAATTAWNTTTGVRSRGIVAVLDTGVDYNHPDLAANIWQNPNEVAGNGVDDDANGYIDDVHGINAITNTGNPMDDNDHGSHCSGTIAGTGNNGVGVVGVNWQAQVIGVKFLDAEGSGDLASEVRGLNYIADLKQFKGIDIVAVNASYGSSSSSQAEFNAIARLRNLGILFMAAAGNDSANNDVSPSFPANFNLDNIISVAAIQIGGNLASFSNYGATKVHIAAPGEDIVSTVPGNRYASFSGTSMATPHVTGAAALLKSAHPEYTAAQIRQAILSFGTPYPTLIGLVSTGRILNLAGMMGTSPSPQPDPAPTPDPQPEPQPEPQPQPGPGGVELFDIAVGGDAAASQKVMSNKGTVYVAMAHNSQSEADGEVAYLMATINGVACPQVASAEVADGEYVLVSGKFKDLPRSSYVTFYVLNGAGQLTDHDTVLVLDRKNRGKMNYTKACRGLFNSLQYAN